MHRRPAVPTMLVLAVCALALAMAVFQAGCGGDSSSDGDMKTYTDPDFGFSFSYPADWRLEQSGDVDVSAGAAAAASAGVYDPDGAKAEETFIDMMLVSVYQLSVTVDESRMPQIKGEVEAVLKSIEDQAGDIRTLVPLGDAKVGGMSGYSVTYSFAHDGAPVTSTLYFMFQGDIQYQLTVQAADQNWEALQPTFTDILDSFEPSPAE